MNRAYHKAQAKQQIRGNLGTMFLIGLLSSIIYGTGIGLILMPAISLSIVGIYLNMTRGYRASVGDMFSHMGALGKAWWLNIITSFFLSLWSMLFFIPGIIKGYSYSMAPYALAANPNLTARQALNISKDITRGHKWELFVLELSFIGWSLLVPITCGLINIWLVPYMECTTANVYNELYALRYGAAIEGANEASYDNGEYANF